MYQYLVISFQKSAAVHLARHCPSTRTERIFMDWLWWILQGLPFTHLVSYFNLTVLIKIPSKEHKIHTQTDCNDIRP